MMRRRDDARSDGPLLWRTGEPRICRRLLHCLARNARHSLSLPFRSGQHGRRRGTGCDRFRVGRRRQRRQGRLGLRHQPGDSAQQRGACGRSGSGFAARCGACTCPCFGSGEPRAAGATRGVARRDPTRPGSGRAAQRRPRYSRRSPRTSLRSKAFPRCRPARTWSTSPSSATAAATGARVRASAPGRCTLKPPVPRAQRQGQHH